MQSMKALVIYGPNDYRVEADWPLPAPPEGWALVRVAFSGVCGSDLPRFFSTGSYHSPMVLGHEFSGVVERSAGAVPEGTRAAVLPIMPCGTCRGCVETKQPFHCERYGFIGSRDDGGFAQYCAVPEACLFPLPDGVDMAEAALVEPLAVGLHAVRRSGFKGGRCVVFGAGPIGLACALWLQFLNADVTVVDVRDYSLGIAKKLGLDAVRFSDLPCGARFDYGFEASGAGSALVRAVEAVRDLGAITVVGRNAGDTVFKSAVFEMLMRKELALNGCWGYNLSGEKQLMRDFLVHHDLGCMISHRVSLQGLPELLGRVKAQSVDYCKIMIDMEEGL